MCVNLDACGTHINRYVTNSKATNLTGNDTQIVMKYLDDQKQLLNDIDTLECPI